MERLSTEDLRDAAAAVRQPPAWRVVLLGKRDRYRLRMIPYRTLQLIIAVCCGALPLSARRPTRAAPTAAQRHAPHRADGLPSPTPQRSPESSSWQQQRRRLTRRDGYGTKPAGAGQ
ncbi:hypothetical protein DTO166G4_4655 [Paecilomyces variotii]|nr:hypothetical protein DTO166G4_4655 [Paecilomyces variotii]KAJ9238164.1 hypothetical protein DTO166G5_3066 [Paecilomyces variotii]KAJ9309691.1 hypothetical protein DTO217A2_642 [Paecilomyces variotii]KAJ9356943.1 hypothetical protein DTO280E4_5826 [Paecilomyces variotii]KAJ9391480.1 hypothetical protein DTO063F5_1090 [Paecilomyces variotii]